MRDARKIAVALLILALFCAAGDVSAFAQTRDGKSSPPIPPRKSDSPSARRSADGQSSKQGGKKSKSAGKSRKHRKKSTAASQPAAAPEPATQPSGPETASQTLRRLNSVKASKLKDDQLAMRAALAFCLALGDARGDEAAQLLDATGYQPLPSDDDLWVTKTDDGFFPEPPRPRKTADVAALIAARPRVELRETPSEAFEIVTRAKLKEPFPAAAEWMLPNDFALLIQPATPLGAALVRKPACLVIRVRGNRPAIVGGNLLESLR